VTQDRNGVTWSNDGTQRYLGRRGRHWCVPEKMEEVKKRK
jgi:hypothetical protein